MRVSSRPNKQVKLTNDGDLALYFIGCGSAFAKTLYQNNLLIVKGDRHLLIDCGTRCSQALFEVGVGIPQIQNFLITHSHADHIGGLEEVMMYARYINGSKPNIVINNAYEKKLWEQSLRGGAGSGESDCLKFSDFWNVVRPNKMSHYPRETWGVRVGDIDIKMPRTMHVPDDSPSWRESVFSCGVIIDERVLYTSDTRFDVDLIQSFDKKFDLEYIFHDCQMFTGGVHSSIEELATLPDEIKRKLVLMHYGDNWRDFKPFAKSAGFHSWAQQGHTYHFEPR
jgi:ribonuclease BN (tRNA processing enzyme)